MGLEKCLMAAVLLSGAAFAGSKGDASVGLVEISATGNAKIYTTKNLNIGEKVDSYFSSADGTQTCCAVSWVIRAATASDDFFDVLGEQPIKAYKLSTIKQNKTLYLGLAVAPRNAKLRSEPESHEFFIFENRKLSVAKTCFGREGMHALQSGEGDLKTHIYKRFDFEVQPTCTAEDLELENR